MKTIVVGVLFIVICIVGGLFAYQRFSAGNTFSKQETNVMHDELENSIVTGVIEKAVPQGDDYTHYIMDGSTIIPLNSYSVDLDMHIGESVEVSGQYSGNTLFVDEVTQ